MSIRREGKQVKAQHWHIEKCFRTIKQQCHAQDFFLRSTQAIQNHIFCALRAFHCLTWMVNGKIIYNVYALQPKLFVEVQKTVHRNLDVTLIYPFLGILHLFNIYYLYGIFSPLIA